MKKQRLDSISGTQDIASRMRKVEWPKCITYIDGAQIHFQNIIAEKATAFWTDQLIEVAALLAVARYKIIKWEVLEVELSVLDNDTRQSLQACENRARSYTRILGLHDAAKGNPADRKKRNELAQEIESGINKVMSDDYSSLFN